MDPVGKPNVAGQTRQEGPTGQHRTEVSLTDLQAILEHARSSLSEKEFATLKGAMQTLAFLTRELEKKNVSIQRLRQMLFGAATESTAKVLKKILDQAISPATQTGGAVEGDQGKAQEKPKGHGRNGADAYAGARKVRVPLASLRAGDACPHCAKGTVYASCEPGLIVRLTGQAPIGGAVYELEKLRCHLCGQVFTAPPPAGVGTEKYDAESAAMIGLLKYGAGLPFNRLEKLQAGLEIPLPAATQWQIVAETAGGLAPALKELVRQAAQGEVVYNDDTTMKVLALGNTTAQPATATTKPAASAEPAAPLTKPVASTTEPAEPAAAVSKPADAATAASPAAAAPAAEDRADQAMAGGRKGVFTSGIIAKVVDHTIALFFTGHKHAGENLLELLRQRCSELEPPIQMCDALSRNLPAELRTILAHCLAHARRKFVDVAGSFPSECLHVLQVLKLVYANDALAKAQGLSPEQRLHFHQARSGPAMAGLEAWMDQQIQQRKVEPNSGLGQAIAYMQKHWNELTLFLRVPAAPLDNNICERALKKAILHRKNALFYRTENGAHVGDLFMSLIHTCQLNGANPFRYLTELQKHARELAAAPADWMPWNYLAALQSGQPRPAG
ncbi:MAG TPA: transposase [Rhodopila sp.]|nr:transposase [Rhodopila sp.]